MAYTSLLDDYLGAGVFASRPNAATLGASIPVGSSVYYYATDTGVLYMLEGGGSSWGSLSALSSIADDRVLANISGSSAVPTANTLSAIIDACIGGTQGNILYRDGSSWVTLAPGTSGHVLQTGGAGADPSWVAPSGGGGSGAMTLISKVTTSASQSTVSFTSIATSYNHLKVIVNGRGANPGNFFEDLRVRFNNDTGANYYYSYEGRGNSATTGGSSAAQTGIQLGNLPGATGPSNGGSATVYQIPDYLNTTFTKTLLSQSNIFGGTTAALQYSFSGSGFWNSTSAINRVDVTTVQSNFVNGSTVCLYGIL